MLPEGAKIVMRGDFPHERHWNFVTYAANGEPREVMGEYLPRVVNLHEKARFEALGCPVDKARLAAMAPPLPLEARAGFTDAAARALEAPGPPPGDQRRFA